MPSHSSDSIVIITMTQAGPYTGVPSIYAHVMIPLYMEPLGFFRMIPGVSAPKRCLTKRPDVLLCLVSLIQLVQNQIAISLHVETELAILREEIILLTEERHCRTFSIQSTCIMPATAAQMYHIKTLYMQHIAMLAAACRLHV